ncbi:hypothetical protein HAX54_007117 [Datura stramonium]|uniref:Uncharacterized protein n=1 Tax=Datura stramonium TaxID=4076 RepID=A0ABS8TBB4_DATST|nr:hypothetical protein [Datura stramonium]
MLLTLQYGAQPLISKRFVRREVIVTSSVLTCEVVKVICAVILMAKEALFTYIILRQKQSIQQIGALFLLIMAAVLLSVGEGSSKASSSSNPDEILFYGIIPVLLRLCAFWSGCLPCVNGHLRQVKKHSSYLMTVEMSIIGSLCLISSTSKSPDGEAIKQHGFFHGWTALTLQIIFVNTSYAGGVRNGFVIIVSALLLSLLCSSSSLMETSFAILPRSTSIGYD